MPGIRRILYASLRSTRSIISYNSCLFGRNYAAECPSWFMGKRNFRTLPVSTLVGMQQLRPDSYSTKFISSSQSLRNMLSYRYGLIPFCINGNLFNRTYSSHPGDKLVGPLVVPTDSSGQASDKATNAVSNEWVDGLNNVWQSSVDAASNVGEKVKEMYVDAVPYVQQLYESYPYLEKVIVPVGGTLSATVVAWFIMPRILRKLHKYSMQSPLASLSWSSTPESLPYEKSLWNALEDPLRYLATFMAFSQLGVIIAPTTMEYLPLAWRGAVVLSFVWFLNRWKANVLSNALANQATTGFERDKLLAFEKLSSVGLIILGVMALAEACGVAVQSILTVGGIGGVATAFAARDILGNLLSGLSVQFSRPFSLGDNIKV